MMYMIYRQGGGTNRSCLGGCADLMLALVLIIVVLGLLIAGCAMMMEPDM